MDIDMKKVEYYERKYERNPIEDATKAISNKWTLHILRDLFLGRKHFTEFKKNKKTLDNKALTRCLKTMEENGLISKKEFGYKETEYYLTSKGEALNKVFYELILFALTTDENNEYYSDLAKKEISELYKEILKIE